MDIDHRKRKRASATLTQSRAQLHRNRSGQLRFDLVPSDEEPHAVPFPFHRTNSKKPKREHDEPLRILMKDLRARRVYSPPQSTNSSLIKGAFLKWTADDSDCTDMKLAEGPDMGLSREARSFDLGNAESLEENRKLQDCKGNNDGYCPEKIDGLDGKALPTTLPDSEVLRPHFQGKLFKIPGSANYRRLCTFLRENSGTPKLGFGQKNEGGEQEKQHPLSSQNQEASKEELKTDGCTTREGKCLSEAKVDSTADNGVNGFRSDLPNDGLNQLSSHTNEVNAKPMDFTRRTQGHAGELFSFKAGKGKDFLKSKSVPRQNLHKKLFIAPGGVSYKRLLPFLMNLTKDDSDTSKFDHQTHIQDEKEDVDSKRFQLTLSSQTEEASIVEPKRDSSPMHGAVESNGVENCVLVYTSNELSHAKRPILTSSQDLPELPIQWDSKEGVCDGLSAPSVNELMEKIVKDDECLTASELNPCSVMEIDFHSAKIVANVAQNEDRQESRRHKSESPLNDQIGLFVNSDVSELTFVHHSNREKGFTIGYDENKQSVNLDECESVDENVTNHVRVSNDLPRSLSEKIISGKSDMGGDSGDKVGRMRNEIVICSTMPSEGSNNNAREIKNEFESKITSVLRRSLQFNLWKHAGSLNCKRLFPFLLNSNSGTQHQIGLKYDSSSQKFQIPEFQSSRDSWEVTQLQDEQVASNGLCKTESSTDPSISDHEIELPVITKEKTTPPLSKSSTFSEIRGTSSFLISCGKQPETHKCGQSLSQPKVVGQLGDPAVGLRKGILKRNPRGCRGLCTCLNCVSFRLHAERAFEFSKNQLLEAEEVAYDLMKELSLLRNMLEKSADTVNINPVFDESQVREACRKAFAAEKTAEDRLNQMQDDLNTHSRITSLKPPRVTFALNVEEKIIPPGR
ncbi:hypothetical protein V8G54_003750 [Vigna mungo]|uniref:Uncharacterized protein n=1 Tax=Vigna mungo TaxID=3915 RepID=A0AAQ3PCA7_VIGMU